MGERSLISYSTTIENYTIKNNPRIFRRVAQIAKIEFNNFCILDQDLHSMFQNTLEEVDLICYLHSFDIRYYIVQYFKLVFPMIVGLRNKYLKTTIHSLGNNPFFW